ncbi:MAG: hypothetical protein H5T69_00280 [Chloroflexi bacterium]|nr:hypothetical protein [Chloroflexota bacterium]
MLKSRVASLERRAHAGQRQPFFVLIYGGDPTEAEEAGMAEEARRRGELGVVIDEEGLAAYRRRHGT